MIKEKLQTTEAKAAQVVIAKVLDLTPNAEGVIVLSQEDVDALQIYINDAISLNPTTEEAIASAVLLVNETAEKSENEKFKSFASKVSQAWEVISDDTLGTLEKITKSIGILFQGKKRAISLL